MKLDVNRLGLSVAAMMALCFVVGYMAMVGMFFTAKMHPHLLFMHLNGVTMVNAKFVASEFIGGLVTFAAWGYVMGAVVALVYDKLDK
jgi:Na+/H+-translocating membrane pyrophosphatase